jgi:hypothetical protein
MASILDAGFVSIFSAIFVFLLVYAVVWAALGKMKILGNPSANAIVAFAIAFLMAIAPPARNFVTFIAPWYVALALVLFFILFMVGLFGKTDKDFPKIIEETRVWVWIVIVSVVIFLAGLAFSFGQQALEAGAGVPPGAVANPGSPNQDPYIVAAGPFNGYNPGPQPGEPGATATNDFSKNLLNTMLHPKVLGLLITFVIAAVAVYFLSQPAS